MGKCGPEKLSDLDNFCTVNSSVTWPKKLEQILWSSFETSAISCHIQDNFIRFFAVFGMTWTTLDLTFFGSEKIWWAFGGELVKIFLRELLSPLHPSDSTRLNVKVIIASLRYISLFLNVYSTKEKADQIYLLILTELSADNYFRKKLHLRYLTRFLISLCLIHMMELMEWFEPHFRNSREKKNYHPESEKNPAFFTTRFCFTGTSFAQLIRVEKLHSFSLPKFLKSNLRRIRIKFANCWYLNVGQKAITT